MEEEKEDRRYYVYVYLNPLKPGRYQYQSLNVGFLYEPFYVGKGRSGRWKQHLKEPKKYLELIRKWLKLSWEEKTKKAAKFLFFRGFNRGKAKTIHQIQKTGIQPHIIKIIENCTNEESYIYEQEVIEWIGRRDRGKGSLRNRCTRAGGDRIKGHPLEKEIYAKLSAINKAKPTMSMLGKNHTPEAKKAMGDKKRGKPNYKLRGLPRTEKQWEHIRKNSERCRGVPLSDETKKKLSLANRGRILGPEHGRKSAERRKEIGKKIVFKDIEKLRKIRSKTSTLDRNPRWIEFDVNPLLWLNEQGFIPKHIARILNLPGVTEHVVVRRLTMLGLDKNYTKINSKVLYFLISKGYDNEAMGKLLNSSSSRIEFYTKKYFPNGTELYWEI